MERHGYTYEKKDHGFVNYHMPCFGVRRLQRERRKRRKLCGGIADFPKRRRING